MTDAPLVSIVCDTYNQKDYIAQALDSFLMQRTTFPVEIIVHDDASTDGTADIVRAYEAAHPDRIRGVYRSENAFSKDPKILEHFVFPLARGKYTAICEGDDYWTSPDKLQRQVDYLIAHPECALCICAHQFVDAQGRDMGCRHPLPKDGVVPVEDVIRGMGGYCATASIVVPTHLTQNRPAYCDMTPLDDMPLQLHFASSGTTYCFYDVMCAYRVNAVGSWTVAQRSLDKSRRIALQEQSVAMHRAFDAHTAYRWHEAVEEAVAKDRFEILWLNDDVDAMRQPPYRAIYKTLPARTRLRLRLQKHLPGLTARLRGR